MANKYDVLTDMREDLVASIRNPAIRSVVGATRKTVEDMDAAFAELDASVLSASEAFLENTR